jgi:hypothetical protein
MEREPTMKKTYQSYIVNNKLAGQTLPSFDHKEAEDDDCGPPQDPIFSNYAKYQWQPHKRSGEAERENRFEKKEAN